MTPAHSFTVAPDDPSLDGHFPSRPVVPGVVLLDEALAAIARETGFAAPVRLARVKFVSPVMPGEEVAVLLAEARGRSVSFACAVGDRRVLSGVAEFPGEAAAGRDAA